MDGEFESDAPPAGTGLRTELGIRGLSFAASHGLLVERTDGNVPGILFGRGDDGQHGNFHPLSYRRICANPYWVKRLQKVHTGWKRARIRSNWEWKELDCANSSDALLMNIFCYPGVMGRLSLRALLGTHPNDTPEFGYLPRIPMTGSRSDTTEIDMAVGDLLVEAKLTESNFQNATPARLRQFRDVECVFDIDELPCCNRRIAGYQLIRGALAAYAAGRSYCVFCDGRRPDLIEEWYRVMCAVRPLELRCRLKLLTWQELAWALPEKLQRYLAAKYGIVAR